MSRRWYCPACNQGNRGDGACRRCGQDRPVELTQALPVPRSATIPTICPADRHEVRADGFCAFGGGYIPTMTCPFACPLCRQPLGWAGDCPACKGCTTGRREDWTFPGQRYECDSGHWVLVDAATMRPVCVPEDNQAGMRALRAILGRPEAGLRALLAIRDLPVEPEP